MVQKGPACSACRTLHKVDSPSHLKLNTPTCYPSMLASGAASEGATLLLSLLVS